MKREQRLKELKELYKQLLLIRHSPHLSEQQGDQINEILGAIERMLSSALFQDFLHEINISS